MPDEKRIKDFEPATNLLIDDWIAVDSPSQGTRKMQKSMFMADEIASLQTLSTAIGNAQIDIGNLQTRAGMSQSLNFGDNLTDGVNILSVLLGAEPYVNTRTYAVGEYCIYEKQLYKCTTAVTSAEDFDSEKWTLTNVKTELTELNSSKATIKFGAWTPTFGRDTATNVYGNYVFIGRILFITAQWTNTHSTTGASYINANSLPTIPDFTQNYGFHGTWRSNGTDKGGEIGQFKENQALRFSMNGSSATLPNEEISFNAICYMSPNN